MSAPHGTDADLPRYQKRGPIEASKNPSSDQPTCSLPRYQKRGPIEASGAAGICSRAAILPRYQKRGPIEAVIEVIRADSDFSPFRATKSAAPLKL